MRRQVFRQCVKVIDKQMGQRNQGRLSIISCTQSTNHKELSHQQHKYPFQTYARTLSTSTNSTASRQDLILPGNIVKSNLPDIDIPEMSFHEFLFLKLDEFKNNSAMTEYLTGKTYKYKDVKENAIKVASALTQRGYQKGDTICAFSTNNIEYSILMLAASCLGLIFTAANPTFTAEELARQISNSESIAIFTIPELAETAKSALQGDYSKKIEKFVFGEYEGFYPFQKLLEDNGKAFPDVSINPREDIFLLPYSSGTTGFPKGVMLTHHNILANVLQIVNTLYVTPEDNILGLLPLYHIYGMVAIQYSLLFGGGHLHYLPKFEPESFLKCLQECKVNLAHIVPPLILFLAKHPMASKYNLTNMKSILSAAAPLGKELTVALKERFPDIKLSQGYGMTELSPATNIDVDENLSSVGPLLSNTLAKVVHLETGESLGPNEEGELCMKGPQVMKGYFKNQPATDEMISSDGWLHTGDIAYYNESGLFYISDRLKELIKYKGAQIAPAELEALLFGHDAVLDTAVVGIPNTEAGEVPRAYVVKKPNSTVSEEDIMKFVEERVSHVKKLRGGVKFVDEIPKNPSGKILRRLLKAI